MKTVHLSAELQSTIQELRNSGKTVGFVPTMGALHNGHLSLIAAARKECDVVISSIFVNPTQFNDAKDFSKYPRTLESDSAQLAENGCDILFAPTENEVYPTPDHTKYTFGHLDSVMEAKFRDDHFNGVGMVVRRLFELVTPHKAFFGEKDYQQLMVIKSLVKQYDLDVEVIGCPIIREESGLAMSSRNQRLSNEDLEIAIVISKTLFAVKDKASSMTVEQLETFAADQLKNQAGLELEYFEVADAKTLTAPIEGQPKVACVAAYIGDVRLIDNIVF